MTERPRYRDVSRLEGFSDAVFAFALTLLVVTLDPPNTAEELRRLAGGFVPFALMFALVSWIWWEHNVFFRRYGLQDPWTVFLNAVLLFVVLFYVYPLKFVTVALIDPLLPSWLAAGTGPQLSGFGSPMVMALYSGGIFLIFALFALLYRHAWTKRTVMGLQPADEVRLRFSLRAHLISSGLAVLSLLLLWWIPTRPQYSGFIYILMGPLHAWNGFRSGRALSKLDEPPVADSEVPGAIEASDAASNDAAGEDEGLKDPTTPAGGV